MLTTTTSEQPPAPPMDDDAIPKDLARHELVRCAERGVDASVHGVKFAELEREGAPDEAFLVLIAELESLVASKPQPYFDAVEWPQIEAALAPHDARAPEREKLLDQIHAGWLGRIAGNMLGKPVENGKVWTRERLDGYLSSVDSLPLLDYIPAADDDGDAHGMLPNWPETTRGRIHGSSRDDDVDYTILNLHVLEKHGREFATADIAEAWLELLPYHQTYTAERAVYRNLIRGVSPSEAGGTQNPYRDWIGALIRADVFGFISPGDPREAAYLAWKDARLSHRGDGLFGEMWAAALVAAAFVAEGVEAVLEESLRHIPSATRLTEEINQVRADHEAGLTWEQAVARIHERHAHRNWVHTLNNAGLITAGLLWGAGDFSSTIGLTVRGGLDTDSSGATAGAVIGVLNGSQGIPARWSEPLNDTVRSAIQGYDRSSITDLAARTHRIALAPGRALPLSSKEL